MKNFDNINKYYNCVEKYNDIANSTNEITRITEKYHLGTLVFGGILGISGLIIFNFIKTIISMII